MDIKELSKPLKIDEIDFRVQSINNGKYATILAYKDARADMNRLDEVLGVFNWKREHTRDNKNCIVSIWCHDKKQWISKEDTGTESQAEKLKGLASDSFKRACFNLGIGRELYDYPIISIKLNDNEVQETGNTRPKYKASFNLKLKEWKWISEFKDNKIIKLIAIDNNGTTRFNWDLSNTKPQQRQIKTPSEKLKECKTLIELQKVYLSLTRTEQTAMVTLKDELKTKLK